jgi:hypothetical protein
LVDSYVENNFTQHLAHSQLDHPTSSYWLGAVALNELNTNTLESAAGHHVSLYSGRELTLTKVCFTSWAGNDDI